MNYLVQGINQGAQNGAQAYLQMLRLADEEKSRKLREQETAAERRLRVQLAADSMANESKLLERRLKAEADGLTWRSTEADKDRTFTAGQELAKKFERDRREALARFDRYDRNNPENVFKAAQIKRLNAEADALSAKQPAEDYVTISEMSPDGLTRTTRKVPASTMPMLNQTQPAPSRVSTDPKIIQENATAYEAYLNGDKSAASTILDNATKARAAQQAQRTVQYQAGTLNDQEFLTGDPQLKVRERARSILERVARGELTMEQANQLALANPY